MPEEGELWTAMMMTIKNCRRPEQSIFIKILPMMRVLVKAVFPFTCARIVRPNIIVRMNFKAVLSFAAKIAKRVTVSLPEDDCNVIDRELLNELFPGVSVQHNPLSISDECMFDACSLHNNGTWWSSQNRYH